MYRAACRRALLVASYMLAARGSLDLSLDEVQHNSRRVTAANVDVSIFVYVCTCLCVFPWK